MVSVRLGTFTDLDVVASQFCALWPTGVPGDHITEAADILSGTPPSTLPLVVLVAEHDGRVVGFVQVGLRSHADGCDPRHPVGFVEGWYVDPEHRRRGVGASLLHAAENWARSKGCREMASDTWLDNEASQRVHETLGFEVVDRCVHYRKPLDPPA